MNKEKKYTELITLAKDLIYKDVDDIANMANLTRLIWEHIPHHWIGFYRVESNRLILGPFQGPIACTTIEYDKGVCGKTWRTMQAQVVADVHQFPGHIACSSFSKSEIVVPCIRNGKVYAVLDIDSDELDSFDELDAKYLKELVSLL